MHITASVYINDAESGLLADYDDWLEKLAPHEPTSQYRHNDTGEDNGDAHLKRQVMGRKSWSPSPTVSWISVRGNRSTTPSSTEGERNEYSSRSSASEITTTRPHRRSCSDGRLLIVEKLTHVCGPLLLVRDCDAMPLLVTKGVDPCRAAEKW